MLREPHALENIRAQLHQVVRAEIQLKWRLAQSHSLGPHPVEKIRKFHLWVYYIKGYNLQRPLLKEADNTYIFRQDLSLGSEGQGEGAGMEAVWTDAEILAFR